MNTQNQARKLQAGEALALPASRRGRLILVQGEVLVQAPVTELSGLLVVPPARRITAPASLPLLEIGALRASADATLVIEQAPGFLAAAKVFITRMQMGQRSPVLVS